LIISNFAGVGGGYPNNLGYGTTGDGGPASSALFLGATNIWVDSSLNMFICDFYRVRKVNSAGIISTYAGSPTIFTAGSTGDGGPATNALFAAGVYSAFGDNSGNLYIGDNGNNKIRKVDSSGIITTFAGNGQSSDVSEGILSAGTQGNSGDGGPATLARLNNCRAAVPDVSGNVYIADSNNNVIRKVDRAGIISTFAGIMYSNNRNSGYYSGEGGPATSCHMFNPYHVYPDIFGNVYIASISYDAIYVVNSEGIISTFAGGNGRGNTGDGGPASSAQLNVNNGLHADIYGNVFIADFSMRIRMVNNAGIISTIAGTHLFYHLLYHHLLHSPSILPLFSLSLRHRGNRL